MLGIQGRQPRVAHPDGRSTKISYHVSRYNLRCEIRRRVIGVRDQCVVRQEIWLEGGYRRRGSPHRARHATCPRGHLEGDARIEPAKGGRRPPLFLGGCPELGGGNRCGCRCGAAPSDALCCCAVGGSGARATARARAGRFRSGVASLTPLPAPTSSWTSKYLGSDGDVSCRESIDHPPSESVEDYGAVELASRSRARTGASQDPRDSARFTSESMAS